MSLKDEIEKVIKAERQKLESRTQGHKEHYERQRDRFQPMRALLDELAASIDDTHLEATIREGSATVKVGIMKGDSTYFEADAQWEIEPNSKLDFHSIRSESPYSEAPGIKVEERVYFRFPDYEEFEKTLSFDTEEEVMNYLVQKIAEQVASYQHLSRQRDRKR